MESIYIEIEQIRRQLKIIQELLTDIEFELDRIKKESK